MPLESLQQDQPKNIKDFSLESRPDQKFDVVKKLDEAKDVLGNSDYRKHFKDYFDVKSEYRRLLTSITNICLIFPEIKEEIGFTNEIWDWLAEIDSSIRRCDQNEVKEKLIKLRTLDPIRFEQTFSDNR